MLSKLFLLLICENYKKPLNYSKNYFFFFVICRKLLSYVKYSKLTMPVSFMDVVSKLLEIKSNAVQRIAQRNQKDTQRYPKDAQ